MKAFTPKHRLIIAYKFRDASVKNHMDGLRTTSEEKARKIIFKRVKSDIHKATYHDGNGNKIKLI
ncbi:MAG: hypothetical protein A2W17_06725 [Planctomycetes bacterium RBG_16_41_13]|nr:MAG: hypothetical protein A2W17_06725 [Planctomycetes bacterium RBG_16_41_13]